MDNLPACVKSKTRIPGQIGWGVERKHLRATTKMLTEDTRAVSFPIDKPHVQYFDKNRTNLFVRSTGERAQIMDKRLGVDYKVYQSLNL